MLIVFEGIDGSGKSTQAQMLKRWFSNRGKRTVLLKEPFQHATFDAGTPAYYLQDRKKPSIPHIKSALSNDTVVIMDRYYYSTMAYQGAKGYDVDEIRRENEAICPIPDMLFVLFVDPEVTLERISASTTPDSWEKLEYLRKVYAEYEKMHFWYMLPLEASYSVSDVQQNIRELTMQML